MTERASRPRRGIGLAAAGCSVLALLAGCASLPGAAVRDDGVARHSYAVAGSGGPVVVFEAGLGDGKETWQPVFGAVSDFTRAFAYDRAGYGDSRSGAAVRDGANVVAELHALLRSLDLPPPYVLVGHSLGGQFVELFARQHPDDIAGVVLVDARHVEFGERCVREEVERCELTLLSRLFMPAAAMREVDAGTRTEDEIRGAGPFPEVPLAVLTATRRPADMPRLRRVWAETQAELVALSPQATQQICDTCAHYIQRDAPDLVIDAIRTIVDTARATGARSAP